MIRSEDGPRPDRAVLAALRRVDPAVYPVWRNWAMNPIDGSTLYGPQGPVYAPCWHLFKRCRDGRHRLLFRTPYFDYRVPHRIASDAGYHLSADRLSEAIDEAQRRQREDEERRRAQDWHDFATANRSLLRDVMDRPEGLRPGPSGRDAQIASYPGQGNHTSGRGTVPLSKEELGLELPWEEN